MPEQIISALGNANLFFIFLLVVFAVSMGYTFIVVYHLVRFGIGTAPKRAAVFFFVGSIVLMLALFATYSAVDAKDVARGIQRAIGQGLPSFSQTPP